MFLCLVFLTFCITTGYGETQSKPFLCGETPKNILECLNNPQTAHLKTFSTSSCRTDQVSECAVLTCAFRQHNWINGDNINKTELINHFNQFSRDNPDVKSVVDRVVPSCLQQDLPPQGVYLNCPAYDIMQCILISYIQKSPASRWKTTSECAYARQFAASCPVCPSECFATLVPYGSCNACYGWPTASSN